MTKAISGTRKRTGRGRPSTGAKSIHLRVLPDQLLKLDAWRSAQTTELSRPDAVRHLVDQALAGAKPKGRHSAADRAGASAMAGRAIDNLRDMSAPSAEQARRKKRLLEGPKEFRAIRAKSRKGLPK